MTSSQTAADAIREAHRRAVDMRASIQQRSQEIKAEQDAQRATMEARDASTNPR